MTPIATGDYHIKHTITTLPNPQDRNKAQIYINRSTIVK
jgi:hypothetical protein